MSEPSTHAHDATWLVDLDRRWPSPAVVEGVIAADPSVHAADGPGEGPYGVVVCSRPSAPLYELLSRARAAQVLVVTVADLDPWPLLGAGAADVVCWDGDPAPVVARLARLREVEALIASPEVVRTVHGTSAALRAALRELVTVARFGTGPMLLLGETGTGKELAARVAHAVRTRGRSRPLVVVDCTTIVPTLSGSELFGHERGAFTGAVSVRTGACAAADGGTLMLDEVGELPLPLQAEFLRVVQEGTYKRVGSDTWRTTRFQLICATHRDLVAEVSAGRFRADLYHRIAASTVHMPPLRERREDLLPLFRAFVAEAAGQEAPVVVSAAVERVLLARSYPGNLRDLRQLAARVAARHAGAGPVTPGDLAPGDRPAAGRAEEPEGGAELGAAVRAELARGTTLPQLRQLVADLAVAAALDECGGNVRAAASRLGVTDRALHLRRAQARGPGDQTAASAVPSSASHASPTSAASSE